MEHVLDAMARAERTFVEGLMGLSFRAKGVTDKNKDSAFEWYALTSLALRPPQDPPIAPVLVGRTMWHKLDLSAHQNMAMQAFTDALQTQVLACVEALRGAVPVLRANPRHLRIVASVDVDGALSTPVWRVAEHGLHGLSPIGPGRTKLGKLLEDLAAEPEPTGIYKIGNKTYAAAGPESALAQHMRLLAPKTPKHQRKAPTTIPSVVRVWDRKEAHEMAKAITLSWSKNG